MTGTIPAAALPPGRTIRCRTVATGALRQLNYVRDLAPLALEERFGPADEMSVATPLETMLAALGSCVAARIHANAASGSIIVRSLELEIEVDITNSSLWDPPGGEPRAVGFDTVRVRVRIDADGGRDALQSLISHAVLWSPVANTIHDPVHLDVTLDLAQPAT